MRNVHTPRTRGERRIRRHLRVRKKVAGTAGRPRLVVFRSLKHIYAQLVDDDRGVVLLGVSDQSEGAEVDGERQGLARQGAGKLLAEKAKGQGIKSVVFDRAGYRYHGRVKAVADGAREGGLEF
jgi:large subunit ribosomal protein L18